MSEATGCCQGIKENATEAAVSILQRLNAQEQMLVYWRDLDHILFKNKEFLHVNFPNISEI